MLLSRRATLGAIASLSLLPAVGPAFAQSARPMRIGVIGAGSLGGTVGRAWVAAGHEVLFSSRNPDELRPMVEALGARASAGLPAEAAAFGSVLLFAVPYDAIPQLGQDLERSIGGKVVLDACNPRPGTDNALSQEAFANGIGETSAKYLPGTRLVRAFSCVDATAIAASNRRDTDKLGVPIAGDDPEAVRIAEQLVLDAGCVPVIAGNLAAAVNFQRDTPLYRANTTAEEVRRLLGLPG